MATLEDVRQRVRQQMLGYTRDQQQISLLADSVNASVGELLLDSSTAGAISRGLVEIDDELVLIKSVDQSTGTAAVMGGALGRGREGSVPAAHSAGALVTMSPLMPRVAITNAINDTIQAMYPTLPITRTVEVTKLAPVFEYGVPAEAVGIHYVTNQTIGPSKIWHPAPRWRFNLNADPGDFPTGKSIQLMDDTVPGRAIRIVYFVQPNILSQPGDDFSVISGYPNSAQDVVAWGACARLVPSYETARLQGQSIEGTERANLVPPKAALTAADYYRQLYEAALERERNRFFDEAPSFSFYQGG